MSLLLDHPAIARARPVLPPGALEPEERVVLVGIGWEGHLALDEELGHDRSGPRFYYLDGELEIMSTSEEHERIKEWIGLCVDDFFFEKSIPNIPRGQATMQLRLKEAGAEPDKSWCIRGVKKFPGLVLEIALTSGGLPKLAIYQRFAVAGGLDMAARRAGNPLPARRWLRLRTRRCEPSAPRAADRRAGGRRGRARHPQSPSRLPRRALSLVS